MGAFNGSGVFVRTYSWVVDAAAGIKIRSDRMDTEDNGFATGLTNCVTRDGQSPALANIPMGGFHHTSVSDAAQRNQYPSFGQLLDGSSNGASIVGGTANVITLGYAIPYTTYTKNMRICFVATAANTGAVTINVDGLGAKALTMYGTTALSGGEIANGMQVTATYDGTEFQLVNNTKSLTTTSFTRNISTKTAAYTLLATDNNGVIECDATTAPFTVTLGTAASMGAGFSVTIKKIDITSNGVTLSALVDGKTIILNGQYQTITIISDGTNWIASTPFINTQTKQYLLSGTGATYTTPGGCRQIIVKMVGGGGGGGATTTNSGSNGTATTFNSISAAPGSGGGPSLGTPGDGGTGGAGSASFRAKGSPGTMGGGGTGGASVMGGSGRGTYNGAGGAAAANSGGGGGGGNNASNFGGTGGGSGEYVEIIIPSPAATYTYTVGPGGAGGTAGTNAGGNGGSGVIIVEEYY